MRRLESVAVQKPSSGREKEMRMQKGGRGCGHVYMGECKVEQMSAARAYAGCDEESNAANIVLGEGGQRRDE